MSCWETCSLSSTRATSRGRNASHRIVRDLDTNALCTARAVGCSPRLAPIRRYRGQVIHDRWVVYGEISVPRRLGAHRERERPRPGLRIVGKLDWSVGDEDA